MLKADIDKQIKELAEDSTHPKDEEFDPSILNSNKQVIEDVEPILTDDSIPVFKPGELPGISKPQKKIDAEAVIVDELLSSVPRAQGYYLKLEKEIAPNEWQLKTRIDNYETWSDLEWELTKLVREMTKRAPTKWGTGKYRIVVWKEGGIRGQKRPPMYFHIDADEPTVMQQQNIDTSAILGTKLSEIAQLTEALAKLNPPRQELSPGDILRVATESITAGQKLATDKEAKQENTLAVMMSAMMQMMNQSNERMMALMANMNKKSEPDPLTLMLITKILEEKGNKNNTNPAVMIKELKEAGLIPSKSETGLTGELKNLTMLMEVARELGSGTERESNGGVLDTLIKSLAPKLPEIVTNVTNTVNKVVDLNKAKLNMMTVNRPVLNPPKEVKPEIASQPITEKTEEEKQEMLIKAFMNKLYNWVINKNYDKFAELIQTIRLLTGGQSIVEDAIKQGTMSSVDLAKFVTDYDKEHYKTDDEKKLLDEFTVEFIKYVKASGTLVTVKCKNCGQEYNYDKKEDFEADKADGVKCEECSGELELVEEKENN